MSLHKKLYDRVLVSVWDSVRDSAMKLITETIHRSIYDKIYYFGLVSVYVVVYESIIKQIEDKVSEHNL